VKKKQNETPDELDQFEAYGEYSYAYRHAAENRRKRKERREPTEPYEEAPPEVPEVAPYLSPEEARIAAEERAKAHARTVTGRLILLLAIAVAVIAVLQGSVFRLTTVYVVGNVHQSAQQIAAASGLVKGLNIFSIQEEDVRRNLSADHTIVFLGMRKDYPSTIYLYITEREPAASTQWLGLLYTLDAEGVVLDEHNTLDLPAGMPSISGLAVTSIHVGQRLNVRDREQLQAYYDIVAELNLQYYREQVVEINLSNPRDIYVLVAGGITVRLGDRQHMRAKIGALRTDIAYLQQLGKTSGVLDVTIPEDAKYRPDG
jgi:cell division protein FtsQ